METSVPDIYAAGDCVETWHRLLKGSTFLPLGTTSHKQGRVAGENSVGGNARFAGSLGTQVVKVFDLAIARTSLREEESRKAGFDPLTVESAFWDHKAYYPGAQEIVFRITGTGDGVSSAGRCTTGADAGISFFSAGALAVFWESATSAGDASLLAFSGCASTNCGLGEPASIESRASGGTASMRDFLFILVETAVD
jgi:NADPH-dependent 2,4-dienoyl-CoA reductase/sulfur reductase-like enzyme